MARLNLKIAKVVPLTEKIKELELVAEDGETLPGFTAGAHIDIETGAGARSYSLANDPAETHRYVIAVLREAGGTGGSAWIHDAVGEGDRLTAEGPRNTFPVVEDAPRHLLIAGGIGITPILSMGYRLRALGARFVCHYCTKSPRETAYMAQVRAAFGAGLVLHHDGGDLSRGIDLEPVLATRPEGAALYVCGPGGLIKAAIRTAEEAGWPPSAIHVELFASAKTEAEKARAAERVDAPFEVEIASSGHTLEVPAGASILEILEAHGIDCLHVCREGWCETCEIGLLEGKADHRDEILSDEEKAEHKRIFVCVSRAQPGEKLVLDI